MVRPSLYYQNEVNGRLFVNNRVISASLTALAVAATTVVLNQSEASGAATHCLGCLLSMGNPRLILQARPPSRKAIAIIEPQLCTGQLTQLSDDASACHENQGSRDDGDHDYDRRQWV